MHTPIQLLLITDSQRFAKTGDMRKVLELALQGGVDTILLREKHLDSAKLLALAASLRVLTQQYQAKLMIHSQADIAQAVVADGVHVDSTSIAEIPKIKAWVQHDILVSASCHNEKELQYAQDMGADFAFLSPVFPTQSHPGAPSLGVATFLSLSQQVDMQVIALGGIDAHNQAQLQGAGLATMGGILDAEDPKKAAQDLSKPA
ncbi:MAG: thiamine phosphate synthase [Mariprofundaceae bacterium]|nr:thiamine phosphate synthase [Mariprofundaceae bacterium]